MDSIRGRVIWFTGLSGAGKSTLCSALEVDLRQHGNIVKVLDGDELRRGLCSDLGFEMKDRKENVRRIASVAQILCSIDVTVLVATISPFRHLHDLARTMLPNMIEVYVDAPLEICESRDPKGLYRRARAGEIECFTGIDSPFEVPLSPDFVCRTGQSSIDESLRSILAFLEEDSLVHGSEGGKASDRSFEAGI
jgi:adenylylsulfate kinase